MLIDPATSPRCSSPQCPLSRHHPSAPCLGPTPRGAPGPPDVRRRPVVPPEGRQLHHTGPLFDPTASPLTPPPGPATTSEPVCSFAQTPRSGLAFSHIISPCVSSPCQWPVGPPPRRPLPLPQPFFFMHSSWARLSESQKPEPTASTEPPDRFLRPPRRAVAPAGTPPSPSSYSPPDGGPPGHLWGH